MPDPSATASTPLHPPGRVRTVAYLAGVSLERGTSFEEVRGYVHEPGHVVWVDVEAPSADDLASLSAEFGFHTLALEEAGQGQQRPKAHQHMGYLVLVIYGVAASAPGRDAHLVEVDLLIGRNYVVTIHGEPLPAIDEALQRWCRGGPMLREGVGYLVYTVLDAVVDAYLPLVETIEDEVDDIQTHIFTQLPPGALQRLLQIKRLLSTVRRVLYPMRDMFDQLLRHEQAPFAAATRIYFHDVHSHVLRILDAVDMEREMVKAALDAHLSVTSNRLNATMKTLTVITAVVAIAGSVFGAWGMNFSEVPFANVTWGFWGVFGGTVLAIGVAIGVGRWWRWL